MATIYKGNILFTKTQHQFEIIENGYIVVEDGKVVQVYTTLPTAYQHAELIDYSGKLIIPGMNDMHVHTRNDEFSRRIQIGSNLSCDWFNMNILL